jgi:hypothetical protein
MIDAILTISGRVPKTTEIFILTPQRQRPRLFAGQETRYNKLQTTWQLNTPLNMILQILMAKLDSTWDPSSEGQVLLCLLRPLWPS